MAEDLTRMWGNFSLTEEEGIEVEINDGALEGAVTRWGKLCPVGKGKQFPSDVLYDIFSRLPIKTLLRFRCVSPLWCTIIDDPDLARTHRLRRVEEPKILLMEPTYKPDPVFREDRRGLLRFVNCQAYSLEGCCNGLLCFTRRFWNCNHSPLFLVNPQRQQVVELQRPPCKGAPWPPVHDSMCSCSYGLGFDCSTNTYKIVGLFFNDKNTGDDDDDLCAQVYTLGRGRGSSWRAVKGPPKATIRSPKGHFYGRPVYARGALHWLVRPGDYHHRGGIWVDLSTQISV
ncbi:F-box/kelch-repeat protein At3g06240-like [Corylus avellana]|uniref:F-box/kelch-repeat protein At3g06240-like n=1 Tax=Corylus avellana TaxID=13451 RepID=UPI00286B9600|nr:F-box/kelch-repeat protein At3g06240-like [Corylus avellana]